ncbi:hypothetical protein WME76_46420 (plasmid) [Sorangium sp. So ce119]|uniref:hypothetical protein n=1 Tax=Sorangium sp. So ce119 TaxID=3133279 RepID=UPI003F613959
MATAKKTTAKGTTTKAAGSVKARATKAAPATKGAKPAAATKGAKPAAATKAKPKTGAGAAQATRGAVARGDAGVFEALRSILQRRARDLVVVHDTPDNYYLDTRTKAPNGKPLFFGAARAGRAYTSFYLMPVYAHPELLGDVSPELKKRMQGKSCFNFKTSEPALFAELETLTGRCFERWKASGQI